MRAEGALDLRARHLRKERHSRICNRLNAFEHRKESKEIIEIKEDEPERPSSPTSPKPLLPFGAIAKKESGILKDIPVDPAVRLTRLKRYSGGINFEDVYELRERDVLGTGMSGGVVVGKNKKTGASRIDRRMEAFVWEKYV